MAFYSSSYYADYHGQSSLTPYYNNYYDSSPLQDSSPTFSRDKFHDHQNFSYHPAPFFPGYDDPVSSYSKISYSASTFSEPMYVEYHPGFPYQNQTQVFVSYSVSDFNFPEFEEYDPTPYSGGYDPVLTYGKPLPPSDEICYPRSSTEPDSSSLIDVSNGPILAPYGKEEVDEKAAKIPQEEATAAPTKDAEQQELQLPEHVDGPGNSQDKPLEMDPDEEIKEKRYNANGGYQIPPGYGLEAMDICESLFGYWPPCLSRNMGRRGDDDGETCEKGMYDYNYWKGTADYLFGSTNPYDRRRENWVGYGNVVYGYERQHCEEEQPLHEQVEYVEDSWLG